MSMQDNFNRTVASEAYKEAYNEYNNINTCEESTKKYDKADMLINSLVSYLRGLYSDRTDGWLDKVLDFYSRE